MSKIWFFAAFFYAVFVGALPNPASVFCLDQGGILDIRENIDGNQSGVCRFLYGECGEWSFLRGDCLPGDCWHWSVDTNSCEEISR